VVSRTRKWIARWSSDPHGAEHSPRTCRLPRVQMVCMGSIWVYCVIYVYICLPLLPSAFSVCCSREFCERALSSATVNSSTRPCARAQRTRLLPSLPSPDLACNLVFNPSQPLSAAGNRTLASVYWHFVRAGCLLSTLHAEHGMHVRRLSWSVLLPPANSVKYTTWQYIIVFVWPSARPSRSECSAS
jgi:hypothetical protein